MPGAVIKSGVQKWTIVPGSGSRSVWVRRTNRLSTVGNVTMMCSKSGKRGDGFQLVGRILYFLVGRSQPPDLFSIGVLYLAQRRLDVHAGERIRKRFSA